MNNPESSGLGQQTQYVDQYDPSLLFPIERQLNRAPLGITGELPFCGHDRWTHFEVSWLNPKGKPQVAIAEITFPCESNAIVESKSMKLYFNSFNQTVFESTRAMQEVAEKDLSAACGAPVSVRVIMPLNFNQTALEQTQAVNIDDLDVDIKEYQVAPDLLNSGGEHVAETLTSDLLRSNCPVTNQPDWASVDIYYEGPQIDHASLLKYIVSFRKHNGFHEECVERMFVDILTHCQPEKLAIQGRFTRRGGLDINPFRANCDHTFHANRSPRQ